MYPLCRIYGQVNYDIYEEGRNKYFKYDQIGHKQRYCPSKVSFEANKIPIATLSTLLPNGASFSSGSGTGRNHLYTLTTHQDYEVCFNVFTGTLKYFSYDLNCLLDLRSTITYMTTYIDIHFGFDLDCISEHFLVSTLVSDSIVAKKVYRGSVMSVHVRDTLIDLIKFDMLDFDLILGMD